MVYEPEIMYFLNEPIRVIIVEDQMSFMEKDKKRVIIKDCMEILDRVNKSGNWTEAKNIILRTLEDLGKMKDIETFNVLTEGGPQQTETLRLSVLPFIVLQLRPTARKGAGALAKWQAFAKYADNLLYQADAQDIIIREEKIEDDTIYIKELENTQVIKRDLNAIVAVTGENRKNIEEWCFQNKWYERHNNKVNVILKEYVINTRLNAIEFTESGFQELCKVFKPIKYKDIIRGGK